MVGTPGPSAVERVGWLRARPGWVGGCRRTLAETACGWELGADPLSPQAPGRVALASQRCPHPCDPSTWTTSPGHSHAVATLAAARLWPLSLRHG